MRNLPFICLLLISLLSSCTKKDNRLFRWTNVSPEADSIACKIEMGRLNLFPSDSLLIMIDHLEKETNILKTSPEIPFMLKASIYNRIGLEDSASILIKMAEALCDSLKHPYEMHRINLIKCNARKAYLQDYENIESVKRYAIKTKDTFLLAMSSNVLGIIFNELGDSLQSRENNEKAIECCKLMNFNWYAQGLEMNLLPYIYANDTALFKSKLYSLKSDESLMSDSVFRVNLILDFASYLKEDWAIDSLCAIASRPNNLSAFFQTAIFAYKADQTLAKGKIQESYDYSLKSVKIAEKTNDNVLLANIYPHHAVFRYKVGMPDSAFLYHIEGYRIRDSLIKEDTRTKILRATERYEIEKSILTKKNIETRRLLIICLIVSTVVILILCFTIWLAVRNGRLKLEAERAKIDTERNRQLVGQTMLRLHEKNQSIINLSNHIEENISHTSDPLGLRKDKRILALNEKGDKSLETTSKLIDEVSSNLMVNLRKRVPNISKSMLQLAVLIACDIPNKEIAEMLGVQPEAIRKQRYRLRALLNLSRDEKLEDVLSAMC